YDNDDIPYRLLIFVQMTGALIVASGVEAFFTGQDLTIPVLGYVVMRAASTVQWLRAARADPIHRPAALRYAGGTILVQVAWVLLLFVPEEFRIPGFFLLVLAELLVPVWAESAVQTPWHAHHISERYGLFTILVLGEALLSTSMAIRTAVDENGMTSNLTSIVLGGLLIVYAMWWLYFYQPTHHFIISLRAVFVWAYGHWLIFGVTAAVGAGLAVAIDAASHHAEISVETAGMAVALPTAIYVLCLWVLQEHRRANSMIDSLLNPVAALLILLTPFTDQPVLFTGILLAVLVALGLIRHLE
ncbi:MAG: low temperature requirement protein A, partial [Chloroflexota bacterium]